MTERALKSKFKATYSWIAFVLLFLAHQAIRDARGFYQPVALLLVVLVLIGHGYLVFRSQKENFTANFTQNFTQNLTVAPETKIHWLLFLLWWTFFLHLFNQSQIIYTDNSLASDFIRILNSSIVAVALLLCPAFLKSFPKAAKIIFLLSLIMTSLAAFSVIFASTNPKIDVYVFLKEGVQALLNFNNPYSIRYTNLYGSTNWYPGGLADFQPYTPLNLILALPAYLLGDVRLSFIGAHLLASFIFFRMLMHTPTHLRYWATLAFLAFPRFEYMFEQSWTDAFLTAAFLALLFQLQKKNYRKASYLFGVLLALKQSMIVFVFPFLFIYRSELSLTPFRLGGLWNRFLIVPLLSCLPFFFASPHDFFADLIWFHFKTPFRAEGLTLSSALHANAFEILPGIATLIALLGAWFLCRFAEKKSSPLSTVNKLHFFIQSCAFSFLLTLIVSKHAFFNYYYFHYCLAIVAWALAFVSSKSHS